MDAWTKRNLNRAENPTGFYEARTKACAANTALRAGGLLKARKTKESLEAASLRAVAGRSEGTPHCDLVERHRQRELMAKKLNGESLKNFRKASTRLLLLFASPRA